MLKGVARAVPSAATAKIRRYQYQSKKNPLVRWVEQKAGQSNL
jgi:hypothetical protein